MIPGQSNQLLDQPGFVETSVGRFCRFLGQGSLKRGPRNPKTPSGLAFGQSCDRSEPFWVDSASWSAQSHTLHPGALQTGRDPFSDAFPLELGESCQDVELQLASRRHAIDAL